MKGLNTCAAAVIVLAFAVAAGLRMHQRNYAATPATSPPTAYTVSGPFTHDNLSIFLLHGKDTLPNTEMLTLQEALEQKKIVVHETKNVNQLSVENVAGNVEIFIQSGDIVKGGQQDRVLAFDMIVPPKSGKVPIASFCVEQGRWQQRGAEASYHFSSAAAQVAGKDLKNAVNSHVIGQGAGASSRQLPAQSNSSAGGQSMVWDNVRKSQMKLEKSLAAPVASSLSPSSLQLTLENKKLNEATTPYVKQFAKLLEGKQNVIGFAVAINGKVESVDVYGSTTLFKKLWPKLLQASAINAVAELQKGKKVTPPTAQAVKAFMADPPKGKLQDKEINARVGCKAQENATNYYLETQDRKRANSVIHKSYTAK